MGPRRERRSRAREGRARSRRDRFGSVPRSVEFRVEIGSVRRRRARGPGPRGGHFGASPTTASSDSRRNVDLDGGEAVRRRVPPRAPDRSPRTGRAAPGPTSTAGSYPTPHGRTLKPPYSTTRRRSVRPRAFMYDRTSPGTTGPRQRPPAPSDVRPHEQRHHRTTLPPHQTPPDPSPPHPDHGHPPRPQAAQHVRPTTTTHHLPRHEPPHRTTTTTNRTRAGTEPNSTRERGGGPPAVTGARRPPPSSAHTIPRIALMGASVK